MDGPIDAPGVGGGPSGPKKAPDMGGTLFDSHPQVSVMAARLDLLWVSFRARASRF